MSFGGGDANGGDDGASEGGDVSPVSIPLYCMITMGDENITAAAFDIATGEIEIEEVTGPLLIRTWAEGV